MARRKYKKKKRQQYSNNAYSMSKYRYRQVYPVKTDQILSDPKGIVNMRVNCWSFTNFYKASTGSSFDELSEPLQHQKNQYDYYRPSYIKIQFTPNFNTNQRANVNDNSIPVGYLCFDPDNFGQVPSLNGMITRDRTKQVNMSRPWTFKLRLPSVMQDGNTSMKPGGWLNAQNEANNQTGLVWLFTSSPYLDDKGDVLPQDTIVGDIMITYYCSFKNRQYNTARTLQLTAPKEDNDLQDGGTGPIQI